MSKTPITGLEWKVSEDDLKFFISSKFDERFSGQVHRMDVSSYSGEFNVTVELPEGLPGAKELGEQIEADLQSRGLRILILVVELPPLRCSFTLGQQTYDLEIQPAGAENYFSEKFRCLITRGTEVWEGFIVLSDTVAATLDYYTSLPERRAKLVLKLFSAVLSERENVWKLVPQPFRLELGASDVDRYETYFREWLG